MKILVVGAGIIGTIYGWALAAGGHEVAHLVRPGRSGKYARGLVLDILDKRPGRPRRFRGTYALKTVESVGEAGGWDLLFVAGHHYALDEVLANLVPLLPTTDVLFVTQNWKGPTQVDAVLPRTRYLWGDAKAGGSWEGEVLVGALMALDIGPVNPSGDALVHRVKTCLDQAGIPCPVHHKILPYLWTQYAVTGGLWPSLVEAGSFSKLLSDPAAGKRALGALGECLGLLEKRGLNLDEYPELGLYRSRSWVGKIVALLVVRWMFTFSEFVKRTSSHALGDPREIRTFYFDILGSARDLGHPMPLFEGYRDAIERL